MDLVIMAAGMATRFGEKKQFVPVYRDKTIMDFSIEYALRNRFNRIWLIIAPDDTALVTRRYAELINSDRLTCIMQRMDAVPVEYREKSNRRVKPWGTGHVLYLMAQQKTAAFCLINADDFYGETAFQKAAEFAAGNPMRSGLVAYRLGQTLSANGSVSRAHCRTQEMPSGGQKLTGIHELKKIRREGAGIYDENEPDYELQADTPVSLNFWLFQPTDLRFIAERFGVFLAGYNPEDQTQTEFLLPDYVQFLLDQEHTFEVILNSDVYFGLTYRDDLAALKQHIAALVPHKGSD